MQKLDFTEFFFYVGVVTAFAGRDIIGNMLNGFILQFTEPFIVGDYIKVPLYVIITFLMYY
jgi:small-conductance mechanosensitive channel